MISLKNGEANWVVIHIAHGAARAERVCGALRNEGFLVKTRPVTGLSSTDEDGMLEILALTSEAKEARKVLIELGLS